MGGSSAKSFGTAPDGIPVTLVQLQNGGSRAAIMTWGASLQDFVITDWDAPVLLGSPDFAAYLGPLKYCGAIVGRVANRIAMGRAPLDGRMLELERNENGRTCLHGGNKGCGLRNWAMADHDDKRAVLTLRLGNGEDGFPGNLDITAVYELDEDGALILTLTAQTDAPTFCNLAHHAYWSFDTGDRLQNHSLTINADTYLPIDADLIPLGAPESVAGTRFDFRQPRPVKRVGEARLDHNFCLGGGPGLRPACRLEYGGIALDVETNAAGLQIYEGAHIDSLAEATLTGTNYPNNAGIAIEPQAWPDAPNHPDYPDIRLDPGETFHQVSRFHAHARD